MGSGEDEGDEEAEISNFFEQEKQISVIKSFKGSTSKLKGVTHRFPTLKFAFLEVICKRQLQRSMFHFLCSLVAWALPTLHFS